MNNKTRLVMNRAGFQNTIRRRGKTVATDRDAPTTGATIGAPAVRKTEAGSPVRGFLIASGGRRCRGSYAAAYNGNGPEATAGSDEQIDRKGTGRQPRSNAGLASYALRSGITNEQKPREKVKN